MSPLTDSESPTDVAGRERVAERGGAPTRRAAVADSAEGAVLVSVEPKEVHEHYIGIRDAPTGDRVVTVIELLSPTNRRADSDGGRSYKRKQSEALGSDANLVEIDLLRGGNHVVAVPRAWARCCLPRVDLVARSRGALARGAIRGGPGAQFSRTTVSSPGFRRSYSPLFRPLRVRVARSLKSPSGDSPSGFRGLGCPGYPCGGPRMEAISLRADYGGSDCFAVLQSNPA